MQKVFIYLFHVFFLALLKNARWAQTASEHVITVLAGLAVVCFVSAVILGEKKTIMVVS